MLFFHALGWQGSGFLNVHTHLPNECGARQSKVDLEVKVMENDLLMPMEKDDPMEEEN